MYTPFVIVSHTLSRAGGKRGRFVHGLHDVAGQQVCELRCPVCREADPLHQAVEARSIESNRLPKSFGLHMSRCYHKNKTKNFHCAICLQYVVAFSVYDIQSTMHYY
jgi:hypothetical protein